MAPLNLSCSPGGSLVALVAGITTISAASAHASDGTLAVRKSGFEDQSKAIVLKTLLSSKYLYLYVSSTMSIKNIAD